MKFVVVPALVANPAVVAEAAVVALFAFPVILIPAVPLLMLPGVKFVNAEPFVAHCAVPLRLMPVAYAPPMHWEVAARVLADPLMLMA